MEYFKKIVREPYNVTDEYIQSIAYNVDSNDKLIVFTITYVLLLINIENLMLEHDIIDILDEYDILPLEPE